MRRLQVKYMVIVAVGLVIQSKCTLSETPAGRYGDCPNKDYLGNGEGFQECADDEDCPWEPAEEKCCSNGDKKFCIDPFGDWDPGYADIAGCPDLNCTNECSPGFVRSFDEETGCKICNCFDPCTEMECPPGLHCVLVDLDPGCSEDSCEQQSLCLERAQFQVCQKGYPLFGYMAESVPCSTSDNSTCPDLYECVAKPAHATGICCRQPVTVQTTGNTGQTAEDTENLERLKGLLAKKGKKDSGTSP